MVGASSATDTSALTLFPVPGWEARAVTWVCVHLLLSEGPTGAKAALGQPEAASSCSFPAPSAPRSGESQAPLCSLLSSSGTKEWLWAFC